VGAGLDPRKRELAGSFSGSARKKRGQEGPRHTAYATPHRLYLGCATLEYLQLAPELSLLAFPFFLEF
jgi:hypothetical protein